MYRFLITLSVIGLSYATPSCHELHKSQLATLSERMNQMISSLYSSPVASKSETNTTPPSSSSTPLANELTSYPYSAYYPYPPFSMPVPQVVYVAPPNYPTPPIPFTQPPTASLPFTSPVPLEPSINTYNSLYYPHKEIPKPYDIGFGNPIEALSPWSTYYEHYPYGRYPSPHYPPIPQVPLPPPPSYPYPEYPSYPKMPLYPPTLYQAPPQPYSPPPTPYPLPNIYHKSSEMPPPYYL